MVTSLSLAAVTVCCAQFSTVEVEACSSLYLAAVHYLCSSYFCAVHCQLVELSAIARA